MPRKPVSGRYAAAKKQQDLVRRLQLPSAAKQKIVKSVKIIKENGEEEVIS
jgi:hypothetical protein